MFWLLLIVLRWTSVWGNPPAGASIELQLTAQLCRAVDERARNLGLSVLLNSSDPGHRTLGLLASEAPRAEFASLLELDFPLKALAQACVEGRPLSSRTRLDLKQSLPAYFLELADHRLHGAGKPERRDPKGLQAIATWLGGLGLAVLTGLPLAFALWLKPSKAPVPPRPVPGAPAPVPPGPLPGHAGAPPGEGNNESEMFHVKHLERLFAWRSYLLWEFFSFFIAAALTLVTTGMARLVATQLLAYVVGLFLAFRVIGKLSRPRFQDLLYVWAGLGLAVPGVIAASRFVQLPSSNSVLRIVAEASGLQLALMASVVVLAGPFLEELWYRKVFLDYLFPIPVAALLFAVVHADPGGLLPLFVLGLVLGWVYRRSRSLWAAWMLHGLWNLNTFLILVFSAVQE